MRQLLFILPANRLGGLSYDTTDQNFIQKVGESFNRSLTFDPSQPSMGFSVRDPLINGRWSLNEPRHEKTCFGICKNKDTDVFVFRYVY